MNEIDKSMHFEMVVEGDMEGAVEASKRALIIAMKKVIEGLKTDYPQPGLTWEQIDYLLTSFEKKSAKIIRQEYPT